MVPLPDAGRLGLDLELASLPRSAAVETDAVALFAESSGRFLVEVAPQDSSAFEEAMAARPLACLGRVTGAGRLRVRGLRGAVVIETPVRDLLHAWQSPELT